LPNQVFCDIGSVTSILSLYISIIVVVVITIYALFDAKRKIVKYVLTLLLLLLTLFNYSYIYIVSTKAVLCNPQYEITILPLVILEKTDLGGVVYPDLGQISIILLFILWLGEIKNLIKHRRVESEYIEYTDTIEPSQSS